MNVVCTTNKDLNVKKVDYYSLDNMILKRIRLRLVLEIATHIGYS